MSIKETIRLSWVILQFLFVKTIIDIFYGSKPNILYTYCDARDPNKKYFEGTDDYGNYAYGCTYSTTSTGSDILIDGETLEKMRKYWTESDKEMVKVMGLQKQKDVAVEITIPCPVCGNEKKSYCRNAVLECEKCGAKFKV